jgi:hypothetical protein
MLYTLGFRVPDNPVMLTTQVGDYHDTLYLPAGRGSATVRIQPGAYAGYAVIHCHFLQVGCLTLYMYAFNLSCSAFQMVT